MKDYSIEINGETLRLLPYTVAISEEVEKIEASNNGSGKFRDKLKAMYDFVCRTADGAEKHLGEFKNADPNDINISFLRIIREYNSPVEEYEREQTNSQLDNDAMEKVTNLLELMSKVDAKSLKK